MILGIVAIIPVIVVMIEYWYISKFFTKDLILTRERCWVIAIGCGTLAGILFNWNKNNLFKNLSIGAISGAIVGACSIWVSGGYLYLRGFPKSLYKAEFILISAILIVIGVAIVSLLNKVFGGKRAS